jgi:hypothetical protein
LSEYFELLISAYQNTADGKLLIEWFREDWGLFEHPRMDDSRAKKLLAEIVNDGEIVLRPFAPAFVPVDDQLGDWENLREELRYKNRFFPKGEINYERLSSLLAFLALEPCEVPRNWFRARIQSGEAPYTADKMGAPPKELASHGRANPAGIPYLYLGSTELTAISETRPYTGEIACVADFEIDDDLALVDLRTPKKTVSPFLLSEPEEIGRMRSDLPFLERLGDELTRPVLPQSAAIDYTPSQYLCEFIKDQEYDGVIYKSSVSAGMNIALFNPKRGRCGAVRQFRVKRVSVDAVAEE